MKALVVFYSRSGNTGALAQGIASIFDAETEEISDDVDRRGMGGFGSPRVLRQTTALCGRSPAATLVRTERQLATGDLPFVIEAFASRLREVNPPRRAPVDRRDGRVASS
jgi:hypothetical protein